MILYNSQWIIDFWFILFKEEQRQGHGNLTGIMKRR